MREFYGSVTYYGIGEIIKRYANFPLTLPCPVAIQHGWSIITTKHDARYDASENWYWSQWLEANYKQEFNGLNTRAVGAPFLYLLKIINYSEPTNSQRKGSIIFPSHSSKLIDMECDFQEYANILENLPDEYKPITVCMYHLDQEKGLHKPFLAKGFKIVNNGTSIYESNFLINFINNTRDKKYAFSNQMTSALLFASSMGLHSFYYGPKFKTASTDPNYVNIDYTQHHRTWESQYIKYFNFPNCDIEKQKNIVSQELGEKLLLSPREMNRLLWLATLKRQYLKLLMREVKASIKAWIKKIIWAA